MLKKIIKLRIKSYKIWNYKKQKITSRYYLSIIILGFKIC